MSALRWESRPRLRQPVMLAAFEGWTDAGAAASGAATYLCERWQARPFADIDAEEFYDFTVRRPESRLRGEHSREVIWPANQFLAAPVGGPHDVVVLIGSEPHLRWRTFCDCVTTVATELGVVRVFTLGAVIAEVAHTRAFPVRGSSADPVLAARFALEPPRYQGPTGIIGVLQDAFAKVAVPVGSLMAQVPHYISPTPSPKATLALVERVCELLGTHVATSDLQAEVGAYERRITEAVAADDTTAAYVRELERRADRAATPRPRGDHPVGDRALGDLPLGDLPAGDLPSGDALAQQLEQFLREQDDSS